MKDVFSPRPAASLARLLRCATLPLCAAALTASPASAQPGTPTYLRTIQDCTTGHNAFIASDGTLNWTVDPGCDRYQTDVYERPTIQTYQDVDGQFASQEYFEYLDIERVRAGFTNSRLYIAIHLVGRDNITSGGTRIENGMIERYGFRLSSDPDGRNGLLLVSDQPELKNEPNTAFGPLGLFGYRDTNGDVGGADDDGPTGREETKTDNPNEESGMNGYDTPIIADGRLNGGPIVMWVRLDPTDDTIVEFAIDYVALGYTRDQIANLRYFDAEVIKGGPDDPQNYLWNDKYTNVEAGSPNPGAGGESEFGTQGLQNIYEVDTIRGDGVRCPADFNGDGLITSSDISAFLSAFFSDLANGTVVADFDNGGSTGSADISAFLNAWFAALDGDC
ncbi:MAG: hypothetical protein H7Y88_04500 [Phycisphaerales bacterium]|nr:hypothetical protein [Phycisphaerales bacterium]